MLPNYIKTPLPKADSKHIRPLEILVYLENGKFKKIIVHRVNLTPEAMKRKIVQKDGIISFTFSCRDKKIKEVAREILGEEEFNKISAKLNSSNGFKGGYTLPTINKWIKAICGNDFEIAVAPFTYLDTCSMVAGSVRRIK